MNFPRPASLIAYASRYAYVATLITICGVLTILMWFLYVHVYQTLTQAELVVELKGHVSTQTLQVEQHQNVIERIRAKTAVTEQTEIRPTSTTTSTPTHIKNPFQATQ